MPSRFPALTNKEISQIIKQAVPEIHEEGVLRNLGIQFTLVKVMGEKT